MVKGEVQAKIEAELAEREPGVEVVLAEVVAGPGSGTLRVFVDAPEGVDHELCARVAEHLRGWLDQYGLEVSSPGLERPLTKPEHFRRFAGHRARVRLTEPLEGRRKFTGEVVDADDQRLVLATDDGQAVSLEFDRIARANLADELGPIGKEKGF